MASNKGIAAATIIAALIGGATTLYVNFNKATEDVEGTTSQKVANAEGEDKKGNTPSIAIRNVFVTPINTNIPSQLYMEVHNSGLATAKAFEIRIDFGESKPGQCEVIPSPNRKFVGSEDVSFRLISVSSLQKDQSIYVVCSLNLPYFNKISVFGGNIEYEKALAYSDYKETRENSGVSFYEGLIRAIMIALSGLVFLWLLASLIKHLDRT